MCSNFFGLLLERLKGCLKEACPCLVEGKKSFHELDDLRKSNFHGCDTLGKNDNLTKSKEKVFTIETMKKFDTFKRIGHDTRMELKNQDGCLILEKCPWHTEGSDLFLRVGKSVFLVHQFLLSIESEILKTIIDSVPAVNNITTMVTLNGYEAESIKMLLTFVYLPESEIDDENVLTLLRLADELMIEELVIRCEDFLLSTENFSPVALLNLAFKYQLPSLEESAAIKASKIPGIEEQEEFSSLNCKQKHKVILMSKNRFRIGNVYSNTSRHYQKRARASTQIERELKSPDMKNERRLHEREDDFQGRLAFFPEQEAHELSCKAAAT